MGLTELLRRRRKGGEVKSLTNLIYETLKEDRVIPPLAEDDWIRVSSIGQICPREEILCAKTNTMRKFVADGSQGFNFQLGHAIHWMMQNRAVGLTGRIVGVWRCTWCGEVYGSADDRVAMPDECIRCGAIAGETPRIGGRPVGDVNSQAFLYMEQFVGNEEYRVGGHPDGFFEGNDEIELLEFKSCNDNNFSKYKDTPDFVHAIQVQIYLWLTKLSKGRIVYINKAGGGAAKPFLIEHVVNYDDEVVEKVKAAVKEVRTGLSDGTFPPRVVCGSRDCSRAINCKVANQCFSNENIVH